MRRAVKTGKTRSPCLILTAPPKVIVSDIEGKQGSKRLSLYRWTPVFALPNVTIETPFEASRAALVPCKDERLQALARSDTPMAHFLAAFRDEFGKQIWPTIGLVRDDADHVKNVEAFGAFRDAVCVSTIVAGHALTMTAGSPQGILHSDAFAFYPWFLSRATSEHIVAVTPALYAHAVVSGLQPQSTPALGNRSLTSGHVDTPLLRALIFRWESCFGDGKMNAQDRRLFRSLEMARAASKTPGGADASEHDAGRAAAMWVSAFEILAYDGVRSNAGRVLDLLERVNWVQAGLRARDHFALGRNKRKVNLAGYVYDRLNSARNDFIHGNPLTKETLNVGPSGKHVHWFAGPLFRLALTARLDLRVPETPESRSADHLGESIVTRMHVLQAQQLAEDAILKADELGSVKTE
jgi:hypothetical protein